MKFHIYRMTGEVRARNIYSPSTSIEFDEELD